MKLRVNREWTSESPYDRFFDFIAPDADRYAILLECIETLGLNSVVIPVAGNRHIFVFPPGQSIKPSAGGIFPFSAQNPVMLVAHYDRVAGSPGANDNSAAVFQLLKAAGTLSRQGVDYWIIVFTDKEELKAGEGIDEQGSFSLAEKLRAWGLGDARVFNFDACGSGDAFIISSTTDYILKNDERAGIRKARQLIQGLRTHALETARFLRLRRVLQIPTPFSDDAGFLKAGIPAQTITMLPIEEASPYAMLLRNRPEFVDLILSGGFKNSADRRLIPETWRSLNGPSDSHLRLTPEFYDQVVRFAVELCRG
ncbi:hypothetical protein AGMMS50293_10240 [Spirochaetia bacterium]|nr:hypothetical protein AGMMS50293_10240 [Spirochaetia bacterium]